MADFAQAVNKVLAKEQYLSDTSGDRGGLTIWGISSAVFPREVKKMLRMSKPDAKRFAEKLYQEKYWKKMGLDKLEDQPLSDKLLDVGVHLGSNTAIRMLQKSLNEFGHKVDVDGIAGDQTLGAVKTAAGADSSSLVNSLTTKQISQYRQIAASSPSQKKFYKGWVKRASMDAEPQELKGQSPAPVKEVKEDDRLYEMFKKYVAGDG